MKNKDHLKQWWLVLISGVVFILIGIWIFIAKATNYQDLAVILSIGFIIVGGLRAFYGINHRKRLRYWGLLFLNGLIELCVFIIPLFFTKRIERILPIYIGFILLFRTIIGMGVSLDFYYSHLKSWYVSFIFSLLGFVASFFMVWNPVSSGSELLLYPLLTLVFVGIAQISISSGLKTLNGKIPETSL